MNQDFIKLFQAAKNKINFIFKNTKYNYNKRDYNT